MKWDFIYYVGIFAVTVAGILGIKKNTKLKSSFVVRGKKHWIESSVMDRL
jgi:hypothetical protein